MEQVQRHHEASAEVLNLFDIKPLRPLMLAIAQKFPDKEAEKALQFLYR
jgi:hypothetical protein